MTDLKNTLRHIKDTSKSRAEKVTSSVKNKAAETKKMAVEQSQDVGGNTSDLYQALQERGSLLQGEDRDIMFNKHDTVTDALMKSPKSSLKDKITHAYDVAIDKITHAFTSLKDRTSEAKEKVGHLLGDKDSSSLRGTSRAEHLTSSTFSDKNKDKRPKR